MTHYIIQTLVSQLLFLAVYDLLLKKETFFQWNRVYLLITPLLSLLLPLVKITALQTVVPQELIVTLPEIILGNMQTPAESPQITATASFPVWQTVFFTGMLLSLFLFFWKLWKIIRLKRLRKTTTSSPIGFVVIPESNTAFSFANTIFLGENLSENAKNQIIAHELVHIRQKHFLDLLFFEALRIVFWFNPLIYIFQKRTAALQEYIADAEIAASGKKEYYQSLLSQVFQTEHISFINTFFNHSLIKKRIVMLQKSKSRKIFQWKYALIIPIVFGMLLYTSCSQESEVNKKTNSVSEKMEELKIAIENDPELTDIQREEFRKWLERSNFDSQGNLVEIKRITEIETLNRAEIEDVPFAVIEKVPVFPGCSGGTNEELKACMSDKIDEIVRNEFNTSIANELGLEGMQRISVQFRVDEHGNVTNIRTRAPHPRLEEEARRVMLKIPQMIPGEHKGKKTGVLYSLPILFEVQK